jgi:hypothetical protein
MDRESIVFALWWTGEEEAFKPISLLAAWPLCPLYITILVLLVSERTCLLDIFIKMKSCDCFRQAQQYYFPIRFDLGHGSWSNQRAKLTPLAPEKSSIITNCFPQRSITSGVTVDSSWVQLLQTVHNTCAALNRVFLIGFWFPCLLNHVMRRTKCWKNLASSQNITLQERQIMCKFRSPYAIMHLVGLTPQPALTHTCSLISHLSCPRPATHIIRAPHHMATWVRCTRERNLVLLSSSKGIGYWQGKSKVWRLGYRWFNKIRCCLNLSRSFFLPVVTCRRCLTALLF